MKVDYDKDYSVEELKELSLWEFHLLLRDNEKGRHLCTACTWDNADDFIYISGNNYYIKHMFAFNMGSIEKQHLYDEDYWCMIEKLPDEVVKKIIEDTKS